MPSNLNELGIQSPFEVHNGLSAGFVVVVPLSINITEGVHPLKNRNAVNAAQVLLRPSRPQLKRSPIDVNELGARAINNDSRHRQTSSSGDARVTSGKTP